MHRDLGEKILRRLLGEMDLAASRDARQIIDSHGAGRYSISLLTTPSRADVDFAKSQGLPVDWFDPKQIREGMGISTSNGNIGLLNRAPHPNAAKVAINWLLSKEGQIHYQRLQFGSNSLRIDIPKDSIASYARRIEGVYYMETDRPELRIVMEHINSILDEVWKKRR
jgi:ABC-type Fe3+ transport system substrate-binding protein